MVLELRPTVDNDRYFYASRVSGLRQLSDFVPHAERYADVRNYDLGDHKNVSRLSPWLRYRLIQEREVVDHVQFEWPNGEARSFTDQVGWRTYFKGWLEQHPSVWHSYLESVSQLKRFPGSEWSAMYERAVSGSTDISCFNHWAHELVSTGYLHNHARMWFASIWIFTLKLPWELGADFFLRHLYDGDPASNTLGWRWVAGLHTTGKCYQATADNIAHFTQSRFEPDNLAETIQALTETVEHPTVSLDHLNTSADACLPCLSSSPAGLLVTGEDLSPEISELSECPFGSICALNGKDITDSLNPSDKVRTFMAEAMEDCADRLAEEWNGEILPVRGELPSVQTRARSSFVSCRSKPRIYSGTVNNWVHSVVSWAVRENLKSVRMFRPPVGYWRRHTEELRQALSSHGIQFYEYRRRWDNDLWEHARRGYFNFRRRYHDYLQTRFRLNP